MRILWVIALVAFLPVAFFATQSSEALNPAIQNEFDLAIDTDVSGNSGSSLGDLDPCASVNQGDFFEVDLVVRGVPEPGIAALAANVIYDPAVLSISAVESAGLMLDGAYFHAGDLAPDSDGDFRIDSINLQVPHNTGDGAILRLTFEALASGGSTLTWDDIFHSNPPTGIIGDGIPDVLYIDLESQGDPEFIGAFPNMRARGAEVLVGTPCPGNLLDGDGDGWGDVIEDQTETLATQACAATATANDEPYDSWPVDMNDDQRANVFDVVPFIGKLNSVAPDPPYTARLDLNANGEVNVFDVVPFIPVLNTQCSP